MASTFKSSNLNETSEFLSQKVVNFLIGVASLPCLFDPRENFLCLGCAVAIPKDPE
jgi:hypothetical protein